MSANDLLLVPRSAVYYPSSDGKPMAENTKQLRWIVVLYGNLAALFHDARDVFVAADLGWYPVEGFPEICNAPDVLVVFGRPKGDRGSYQQWVEDNVPVTVVFEVLSPGNTVREMFDKAAFYEEHGVEEYYVYDPDSNRLDISVRRGGMLMPHRQVENFVSPRLGIRFDLSGEEMIVYGPDGRRFLTFEELKLARDLAEQQTKTAEDLAKKATDRAEKAEDRAEKAEELARATQTRPARLVELGRKARRQEASPQEIEELERLEAETAPPSP